MSGVGCHNFYAFTCATALLFQEKSFLVSYLAPVSLTFFPLPLLQWSLRLGRGVCDMDGPFRAAHAEVTYSLH